MGSLLTIEFPSHKGELNTDMSILIGSFGKVLFDANEHSLGEHRIVMLDTASHTAKDIKFTVACNQKSILSTAASLLIKYEV